MKDLSVIIIIVGGILIVFSFIKDGELPAGGPGGCLAFSLFILGIAAAIAGFVLYSR